jgi:hypothetical protein
MTHTAESSPFSSLPLPAATSDIGTERTSWAALATSVDWDFADIDRLHRRRVGYLVGAVHV